MAGPRLTGLEFHWFSKGQFLATRYQQGGAMDLEPCVAALVADFAEDAKVSFAGPESLRRVALRFGLDADASEVVETEPALSRIDRFGADRHIAALRCLAASFATAASEVEAWKR